MNSRKSLFGLLLALTTAWCMAASAADPALTEGSPAPKLTVEQWLKGTAVPNFEPGRIYVVEFWATWCGPCMGSIPHMNEMAEKYKNDVTFIGMNAEAVFESDGQTSHDAQLKVVTDFLAKNDPPMNYTVAFDSTRTTIKAWMDASFSRGIPQSFVVGRDGKIAYIGHPMLLEDAETGNPLPQIIAGTWAASPERVKYEAKRHQGIKDDQQFSALASKLKEAKAKGDWQAYYDVTQEAKKTLPAEMASAFQDAEVEVLIAHLNRPDEGYAILDKETAACDQLDCLGPILNLLVKDDIRAVRFDSKLAEDVANKMIKLSADQKEWLWYFLPPLTNYYFVTGQYQQAVDWQLKLIDNLKSNPKYASDKTWMDPLQENLTKYQAALKPH